MIKLYEKGAWLLNGTEVIAADADAPALLKQRGVTISAEKAREGTISHSVLQAHDTGGEAARLAIKFDALTSHDITCVGIIQTARASGMQAFPLPYVLTNCHNSLCAVGGTINQDDHVFALSAARKYGGVYVPPHLAVIHSYNREMTAGCGKMILGSDSHTRYGALGTLAVGEGGGELAKQLVGRTYDMDAPEVVGVLLQGRPAPGVGPHDVALVIIAAVYKNGYVKNKVMEFVGGGVDALPVDFRNGVDVMTTETACWSSIWKTDERVRDYLQERGRVGDYRELKPVAAAFYDGFITVDLSKIEPCIALPFHPSNVYTIKEFLLNAKDILAKTEADCNEVFGGQGKSPGLNLGMKCRDGGVWADQAVIAGCAGGAFDNIMAAAGLLKGRAIGSGGFSMSVYPESASVLLELVRNGAAETLMKAGVIVREAFCGPCFGAGDTPANGQLSIRHVTRNFANREGSKPGEGQAAAVALMDARSIAATAANGGRITSAAEEFATELHGKEKGERWAFFFDRSIYDNQVYDGRGKPLPETELVSGPGIQDWPEIPPLPENLLVKVASFITDAVTTTDELIPSGETSSYRSNPLKLAEFTLSRKDPGYVQRAKDIQREDALGRVKRLEGFAEIAPSALGIGSAIYARKPGDGSAREQAASCQRVLGGAANFALEYATKRYRSNLINWGVLPFIVSDEKALALGSYVFFPGIKRAIAEKAAVIRGVVLNEEPKSGSPHAEKAETRREITVSLGELSGTERQILIDGCLINYYRSGK
jgi:aconitate hydratase